MSNKNISKHFFFLFILLTFILIVYFIYDFFSSLNVMTKIIFGIIVLLIIGFIIIVNTGALLFLQEYERAVIFRFGRLDRIGGPGWTLIIPGIENYKKIDLRTQTIDIPKQDVITKDNIMLNIDAVIYLKINNKPEDIVNSVINIDDYKEAAKLYVKSTIRDIIGNMTLNEVISNISELNKKLKEDLSKMSHDWGIKIESVEIKEVKIPEEVIDAMHQQKAAVQKKLATIELAEAEKEKIKAINEAAKMLSDTSLSYYYIKALEEMSKGEATKIIFPMEFSKLADILSGKMKASSKEEPKVEEFLEKYGPLLNKYLEHVKKENKSDKNETRK